MSYTPRLKEKYVGEIAESLRSKFEFKSQMRVPKLEKIVLSQGLGEAVADKKIIDSAVKDMALIAGQQPIATISKKDISNFKLRKGMPVGVKVTLRGDKMYEFLDRFINIALPRTRDFRGISATGFDGRGNFNMGITEHIIFPEIDIDKVNKILGMDIAFVTSTNSDEEGKALLEAFNFPFIKIDEKAEAEKAAKIKDREDRKRAADAEAAAEAAGEESPAAIAAREAAEDAAKLEAYAAQAAKDAEKAEDAAAEEAPATEEAPSTEDAPEAEGNEDTNETESAE